MSNENGGNGLELMPIELALLKALPDEGQTLGFMPIAVNVKTLNQREEFTQVHGNVISGRLRSMQFHGLVTSQKILPVQKGLGWQRTAKGKALLEKQKVVS